MPLSGFEVVFARGVFFYTNSIGKDKGDLFVWLRMDFRRREEKL